MKINNMEDKVEYNDRRFLNTLNSGIASIQCNHYFINEHNYGEITILDCHRNIELDTSIDSEKDYQNVLGKINNIEEVLLDYKIWLLQNKDKLVIKDKEE